MISSNTLWGTGIGDDALGLDLAVEVLDEDFLVVLRVQLGVDALEAVLDVAVDRGVQLVLLVDIRQRGRSFPVRRVPGLDLEQAAAQDVHLLAAVPGQVAVVQDALDEQFPEEVGIDLVEDLLVAGEAPDIVLAQDRSSP